METVILHICEAIGAAMAAGRELTEEELIAVIRAHNKDVAHNNNRKHKSRTPEARPVAKRDLLPYYLDVRKNDPQRWNNWGIDATIETRLMRVLRMKPRRSASGVATITVLTKPWPCANDCLYCPRDVRMPKSYLVDEPACQRAERVRFDPYLQVAARLRVLQLMGHPTDKIELIVLGGTFSDYPESYQVWFASELFRALNEADDEERASVSIAKRERLYRDAGLDVGVGDLSRKVHDTQQEVDAGMLTYAQAIKRLYQTDEAWQRIALQQTASLHDIDIEHGTNETARHRVVGLVVETRPDAINTVHLTHLRALGVTKVQMGVQSLDDGILALNTRTSSLVAIKDAFTLLRIFGFKTHVHVMRNLLGATPESDRRDYHRLVTDEHFKPDEVKLYPCVLVESARLMAPYRDGLWQPYREDQLIDVLVSDTLDTPAYMRISRMIRDISAHDIVSGNKKANLRQMVDERIAQSGQSVSEIRAREPGTDSLDRESLNLDTKSYQTSNTVEYFLQWVTPQGTIGGFLRLSLPDQSYVATHERDLPIKAGEAMIREVHIYGATARLEESDASRPDDDLDTFRAPDDLVDESTGEPFREGVQHRGLGRLLIKEAGRVAARHGYEHLNVISSVGTRPYYRDLGFQDDGLYLQKELTHYSVDAEQR